MPFLSMFKVNVLRDFKPDGDKIPKLMLTVLNGGKDLGSKVKFSKFYLIFDFKPSDVSEIDLYEVYLKVV